MKPKLRTWLVRLMFVAFCLVSVEIVSQLAYRLYKGSWYWVDRKTSPQGMLLAHPFFGCALVPNVATERNGVRIHHNSFGLRGPEFARPNPHTRTRVATLGGSTTYCVGVSDGETWQDFVGQNLGQSYELINMGGAGIGTSIETMVESALLFSDIEPDIAIYHLGWNDARVQHVEGLTGDWVQMARPWATSLAANAREMRERTATGYLVKRALFHIFFPGMEGDKALRNLRGTPDALTGKVDLKALGHYERNLRSIVAVCRSQRIEPMFVPQILNYRVLTNDTPYGWLPFVRDRDLQKLLEAYNATMERVAKEQGVTYVREVLDCRYEPADFIDNGHFSPSGHRKFAAALAPELARVALRRSASKAAANEAVSSANAKPPGPGPAP